MLPRKSLARPGTALSSRLVLERLYRRPEGMRPWQRLTSYPRRVWLPRFALWVDTHSWRVALVAMAVSVSAGAHIYFYNRLLSLEYEVLVAWAQLENVQQKRYHVQHNLGRLMKFYAGYEHRTMQDVTALRTRRPSLGAEAAAPFGPGGAVPGVAPGGLGHAAAGAGALGLLLPGQSAPGQRAPGQTAPGQNAPGSGAPGLGAPGLGAPGLGAIAGLGGMTAGAPSAQDLVGKDMGAAHAAAPGTASAAAQPSSSLGEFSPQLAATASPSAPAAQGAAPAADPRGAAQAETAMGGPPRPSSGPPTPAHPGKLPFPDAAPATIEGLLGRLAAVAEQYPNLQLNQTIQTFSQHVVTIESEIATAVHDYNVAVNNYTTVLKQFPGVLFGSRVGFGDYSFYQPNDRTILSHTEVEL